ncbi:MAG TPA: AAA family ATPase [Bacillota bacterium]|nr:AAA family ATPase [Bacillota bacterium]
MRIKRLFIGDFGILRNQILENIHPGIVVVGGKNRAGKSTFMDLLSHLGSGFTRTKGLPPATSKYLVEADILAAGDKDKCTLRIEGRSAPSLSPPPGKSYTIDDLFPDEFSYKHLYTISLDELTQKPEGLGRDEISQLQSVILGGGYKDVAQIIDLEKQLTKEADDIGGKRGGHKFRTFKPFTEKIGQGLVEKEQALSQLDEHNDASKEREGLSEKKRKNEQADAILKAEIDILEALKNSYEDIRTLKEKESQLGRHEGKDISDDFPHDKLKLVENNYERYKEIEETRDEAYYNIGARLETESDTGGTIGRVFALRDRIQAANFKLPAIKERLDNVGQLRARVKSSSEIITKKILGLGLSDSKEEQGRIEDLPLYSITNESELLKLGQRSKEIRTDTKDLLGQRDDYLEERDRLVIGQQTIKDTSMAGSLRSYILAFVSSVILGALLYGLNELAGLIVGGFGILGSAVYAIIRSSLQKETRKRQQDISVDLENIEKLLKDLEPKIDEVNEEDQEIRDRLDSIKGALGSSMDYDADTTLKYYNALVSLQGDIGGLNTDEQDFKEISKSVREELEEIQALLNDLAEGDQKGDQDRMAEDMLAEDMLAEDAATAYQAIEHQVAKWYALLEQVATLKRQESELASQEGKLRDLMGEGTSDSLDTPIEGLVADFMKKSESKKSYLELVKERDILNDGIKRLGDTERLRRAATMTGGLADGDVSQYLHKLYEEYIRADELDVDYNNKRAQLSSLGQDLTDLTKKIQTASDRIRALEESAKLETAHRKIDQGRASLRPLAYRYALLRTASYMCSSIKKSFLEKMSDELLKPAREMLLELTDGEYKGIMPDDDFSSLAYTFTLSDGSSQESVDVLSRGTREQVFLAVRLGRIIGSKPAPVIIDDSFVNFDPSHLAKAVGLLERLSRTHQVFIMTCHPHLVSRIAESNVGSQYWQLDRGNFLISDADRLMSHLEDS